MFDFLEIVTPDPWLPGVKAPHVRCPQIMTNEDNLCQNKASGKEIDKKT